MKQHLVESCSFARNTYENVTTNEKYQPLVEAAKQFHTNTKLNEDVVKKQLSLAKIDENVQKDILSKLQESKSDIELWKFPISKINDMEHPNLNGRVYGKKLWENVINNQQSIWKGGTGLANHPADDEDGDFMKQSIVWLDGYIGEDGLVYGIGTFVGEGGELAKQIIDAGGRIGFSTSGYGDFLANGVEVDPDTYEIDRFADLVLNPSQGVYGDKSDKITAADLQKESVTNNKENKLTESVLQESKVEENSIEDLPLSEQLILKHYKEAIENIDKQPSEEWEIKIANLDDLTKKIKKENLSKVSKSELNNSIKSLTESIMKKTRKALKDGYNAQKICEELDINDISKLLGIKEKLEDFSALEDCLNKTTKEMNKYKSLYEAKAEYAENEATSAFDNEEKLSKINNLLEKSQKTCKNVSNQLKSKITENKSIRTLNLVQSEKIKDLSETIHGLNEDVSSLQKNLKVKSQKIQNVLVENKELQNKIDNLTRSNISLKNKINKLIENNESLKELFEEAENTIEKLQRSKEESQKKFRNKIISRKNIDEGEEAVNNYLTELDNGPKIDENLLFSESSKKVEENKDDFTSLKDLFN